MRRVLVTGAAALALLVLTALPAAAKGGWATSTLDERPEVSPGETAEIGFTILQHGVTPVNVDDVAVVVRDVDGDDQTWPAVQQGEKGHYVAEVTFPAEGSYDWAVHQGWFGDYDLATLHVGDVAGAAAGSGWSHTPWTVRVALVLPILASVGLFLLDRNRQRRRNAEQPVVAAGA
jgi:hypothetical protein